MTVDEALDNYRQMLTAMIRWAEVKNTQDEKHWLVAEQDRVTRLIQKRTQTQRTVESARQ